MYFKQASLSGELIEWIQESDDEELGAARLNSCRQALSGGTVSSSNGVRIQVGRQGDDKPQEGDSRLFWLGEINQGRSRLYLVLGDGMEEAGEELAIARMVGTGISALSVAGQRTVTDLLQTRPVLVTRRVGKVSGPKVEQAMREVANGLARVLSEQ
jgi:hypothetical protein